MEFWKLLVPLVSFLSGDVFALSQHQPHKPQALFAVGFDCSRAYRPLDRMFKEPMKKRDFGLTRNRRGTQPGWRRPD